MRQVGSLTNEIEANRFAAYLVTEGVSAHVEADGDDWPVWVHDENQVGYARLAFEEFLQDPNGAAYQGVEHQADEILAEERRAREQASRNVIQMRGRWNRGQARRRPLVMAMIIASVITFIASGEMSQEEGRSRSSSRSLASNMLFVDSARYRADLVSGVDNRWYEIQQGQVWAIDHSRFLPLRDRAHRFQYADLLPAGQCRRRAAGKLAIRGFGRGRGGYLEHFSSLGTVRLGGRRYGRGYVGRYFRDLWIQLDEKPLRAGAGNLRRTRTGAYHVDLAVCLHDPAAADSVRNIGRQLGTRYRAAGRYGCGLFPDSVQELLVGVCALEHGLLWDGYFEAATADPPRFGARLSGHQCILRDVVPKKSIFHRIVRIGGCSNQDPYHDDLESPTAGRSESHLWCYRTDCLLWRSVPGSSVLSRL